MFLARNQRNLDITGESLTNVESMPEVCVSERERDLEHKPHIQYGYTVVLQQLQLKFFLSTYISVQY